MIAIKLRPKSIYEIGRPIVTIVCEQSVFCILLINWAINNCNPRWKYLKQIVNPRDIG